MLFSNFLIEFKYFHGPWQIFILSKMLCLRERINFGARGEYLATQPRWETV